MVTFGLYEHGVAEEVGDGGFSGAGAQWGPQIQMVIAEQAQAQATIGGQADAIAAIAIVV